MLFQEPVKIFFDWSQVENSRERKREGEREGGGGGREREEGVG